MIRTGLETRIREGQEMSVLFAQSSENITGSLVDLAVKKGLGEGDPNGRERIARNLGAIRACFHPDNLGVFPGEFDINEVGQLTGIQPQQAQLILDHLLDEKVILTREQHRRRETEERINPFNKSY